MKQWKPKNPELLINVQKEEDMTDQMWQSSNFPFNPLPDKVVTHVNTQVWAEKVNQVRLQHPNTSGLHLMEVVHDHLVNGADSCVGPPGDSPTVSSNYLPDPAIDIPRLFDAFCTEVKKGHMTTNAVNRFTPRFSVPKGN